MIKLYQTILPILTPFLQLKSRKKGTEATGNTDIASWTVDTEISSKKLRDATAKAWVVTIDPNGGVVGINANWTTD